jgi:hypothetical protein
MKKLLSVLVIASFIFVTSCKKDDKETKNENTFGKVELKFDNVFNMDELIMKSFQYNTTFDEKFELNTIKYIVSNIVLIEEDGTKFTYPKDKSYFITNEDDITTMEFDLQNIPSGKYTQISFGLGVDQEKYKQGASGQGDLLVTAEKEEMMWAWQAGYRFLKIEGNFSPKNKTEKELFKLHIGSHGTKLDNYRKITLDLPLPAIVKENNKPSIHITANINKVFNGNNPLSLEQNPQVMINPTLAPKIIENAKEMFMVHHVHN